jgi:hypothetical protein
MKEYPFYPKFIEPKLQQGNELKTPFNYIKNLFKIKEYEH